MSKTKKGSKKKSPVAKKLFKVLNKKTFKVLNKKPAKRAFSKKIFMLKSFQKKPVKEEVNLTNTEIDDLVVNLAGEDVLPLVTLLKGKENVSEFAIADRLNVTVNQVRNMLYRLHKSNLVSFTRKKDKKKGWYIYYWTLAMKNIKNAIFNQKKRQLAEFREKLAKELEGKFYVCPGKCARLTMEDAMELDFHCPECGQLLTEQDNKRTIENLGKRIEALSAEIKLEEEARSLDAAKLLAKAQRTSVKKKVVKKPARPVKPIKEVKKAPVKKVVKKIIVKKAPVKNAIKKPVAKAIKKAPLKKAIKKVVKKTAVRKPAAQKKPEKKGFLSRFFAKKK